jgi:glycosyltransferase involved in cell wall biosynthesis
MEAIFDYTKWPWAEKSEKFSDYYKGNQPWPKLSIIIPSYNQANYIEETILSVINQNYPNLELILIDGGSQDHTVDLIRKYESHISYWVSEKDLGQSHAINKGFKKATGDWIAWINSDDCYLRNAFHYLFNEMDIRPYDFIYGNYRVGRSLSDSKNINVLNSGRISFPKLLRFFYSIDYIIPSQSVFFKNEILKKAGYLNENLHYCMDLEWYLRVFLVKPAICHYGKAICFFRHNEHTKTGSLSQVNFKDNKMGQEAEHIAIQYSDSLGLLEKISFRNLYHFYEMYSREPQKYSNSSLTYLLKVLLRHPIYTLSDRRLLGLFKRKLFPKNKI